MRPKGINMHLSLNLENSTIEEAELSACREDASRALARLRLGKEPMTGWVKFPREATDRMLRDITELAGTIKKRAELFVVIGIGGSYLGARAAIEALPSTEGGIPVRFLGHNLCSEQYREIIEEIKIKKTMVCVISKSGSTMEVRTAFEIIKPLLTEKYGSEAEADKWIVAITDATKGPLRKEASEKGYVTLEIPDDVGGRYSAMTPAGLLPMAVYGIDVRELVAGGVDCAGSSRWDDSLMDYAIARYLLQEQGKEVEFVEFCHSRLRFLGEWIKQLYGESEGKDGKGLLPTTLTFSTDLHSMGQFLQDGRQIFMETMIIVDKSAVQITIPAGPQKGMSIHDMNSIMIKGVIEAHKAGGIPIVEIHMPELDAYNYGQLLHFLETTCAITAMLTGVNPFDQPGVERYKAEMRKLLD